MRYPAAILSLLLIVIGSARAMSPVPPPADALPGSRPAYGTGTKPGDIAVVWLVGPTDRYAHGILGTDLTASGLRVRWRNGFTADYTLPEDSVFEDLTPRLVDARGDGGRQIMVVRSRAGMGSSLALLGVADDCEDTERPKLSVLAETPPIGTARRWLNPVGTGDFDGDGIPEIALVRTPHIGGVLEIWRWTDGQLVKLAERAGYSNHAAGSTQLGLSAIQDMNGDGLPDIVVPTADRTSVAVVSFAGGSLREIQREALPEPAGSGFSPITPQTAGFDPAAPSTVWIGLSGGRHYVLKGATRSPP